MTTCTRCESTGFLNVDQLPFDMYSNADPIESVWGWINEMAKKDPPNDAHDVSVCDCCGDGEASWHGTPGEHYGDEDPRGMDGPYAYNGGLCECN